MDFTGNQENGVRIFRTNVAVRGAKAATRREMSAQLVMWRRSSPFPRELTLKSRYSDEDDLRQVIEVLVACVQNEVVVQHERGDPHVVGRNRRSLLPKLAEDRRVVVGRLVVREQYSYAVFQEESPEHALVLCLAPPMRKAGSKLTKQ